jgi:hypothetical protein
LAHFAAAIHLSEYSPNHPLANWRAMLEESRFYGNLLEAQENPKALDERIGLLASAEAFFWIANNSRRCPSFLE